MNDNTKNPCFGFSWNGGDPQCAGGLDPVYTNPKAKSSINPNGDPRIPIHRRDRCVWFSQCAHQTNFNKMRGHVTPITVAGDVRPQHVAPRSQVVRPAQGTVPVQQPQPSPGYYPQSQYAQPQSQMVPPYIASYGPQVVPMPFQQPGAQMPGYLSVPEPIDPSIPGWLRAILSLIRVALKAICHQGSHMADHEPFIRYPQPPPATQEPPTP